MISTIRTWEIGINPEGVYRRHPSERMIIAIGINKHFNHAGVVVFAY